MSVDVKNKRRNKKMSRRIKPLALALFGCAGSGSEIKNVSLEEVSVSGSSDVGGLVGYNRVGGIITNSYYVTNTSGCSD